MFTGIIEELGEVKKISWQGRNTLLEIKCAKVRQDAKIGDSISVNGACLTVVKMQEESLAFEVIPETIKVTDLGQLRICDLVNLERSLKAGDRLSGHFVLGHVDCVGIIRRKSYRNNNLSFEIILPPSLMKGVILKGSIAVDGISLTVMEKQAQTFNVYVIPHTLKNTTLRFKGSSSKVNIELDILAKKVL